MDPLKPIVERDGGVDFWVVPGGFAASNCAFDGEQLIHGCTGAMPQELPSEVLVPGACADAQNPVRVQRSVRAALTRYSSDPHLSSNLRLSKRLAHSGKTKPIHHHGDFACRERKAGLHRIEIAASGMDRRCVINNGTVEAKRLSRDGSTKTHAPVA